MTMTSVSRAPALALQNDVAHSLQDWARLVGDRFVQLRLSAASTSPFAGVLRTIDVDGTHISGIVASPHRVERREADILPSDPRHLKLTLQLRGTGTVIQDGRKATLGEGDVAVYDTCRPYSLEYAGEVEALVMVFPHHMLGPSAGLIQHITAVRLPGDTGIGRMISPFMRHVAENLEQLTSRNGGRVVRSVLDLVTALLSEGLMETNATEGSWRKTLSAVHQYIDANLHDPELSAAGIAEAHFVSLRYLQYLFHQENQTVTGYIRDRRLERCRIDLQDPALQNMPILRVAQRSGFHDPSHFSKCFKAAYSLSPREYRARWGTQADHTVGETETCH